MFFVNEHFFNGDDLFLSFFVGVIKRSDESMKYFYYGFVNQNRKFFVLMKYEETLIVYFFCCIINFYN